MMKVDELQQFLASALEQSSEGIAIADLKGHLTYVNLAWTEMHGYQSAEELIGKPLHIFHNQEQIDKDVEPFNMVVKEKGKCTGEVGHIRKDGTPFPTMMTTTLLKDELGVPVAILGIAKDITENKQAEEELNLIINLVPGIICTAGTDGFFKSVNPAMERTLGFSKEELLSRPLFDFIHPDDIHPVKTEFTEKIDGRRIRSFENRYLCKDGSYRLLQWYTTSAVDGILYAVALDITKRKLSDELREKLIIELEEALDEVKTLQGIIPICMYCKKIRGDEGAWDKLEAYLTEHTNAELSHGICPDCLEIEMEKLDNEE